MRRRRESGQAVLLMVTATGLVLAGALGLAIDGAQLWGHRQMAQTAADAAAQAAAMSILGGTNVGTNAFGSSTFTCSTTDVRTPCVYARFNGFGSGAADTVTVDFPSTVPGVDLSPDFPTSAVHVLISRSVNATLLRFFGASATNVVAAATAALVQVNSPVPILVLHPTLDGAMTLQGTPNIKICGGDQRSIQVNSISSTAIIQGGTATVDLSRGGPADTLGNCTTGTGSDLGVFGGPASIGLPSWMTPTGTTEHYRQPAAPIHDPLEHVLPPAKPGTNAPAPVPLANGAGGCPVLPSKPCMRYFPGLYPTGIEVKNETAVFDRGIYYIDSGGFKQAANGDIYMCAGCATDPDTGSGMLVYLSATGGVVSVGANSTANMRGADVTSAYLGMLFFVDRNAPAQTHSFGGGGVMSLQGTIYATNTNMTSALYQTVSLLGGSGSSTLIKGQIIVSVLRMGGNGGINMQLDPNYILPIDQVALVR